MRAGDPPDSITIGGPIVAPYAPRSTDFAFQGTDPDNDIAEIKIELRTPAGINRVLRDWSPYSGGWTFQNITFNEGVGTYYVWASVKDAEGNTREPWVQGLYGEVLPVVVTHAPLLVVDSVSVTPDRSASPGGSVTISASATDADGDLAWMDFYVNPPDLSGWQKTSVPISGYASGSINFVWNLPVGAQTGTWKATVRLRDAAGLEDDPEIAPEPLFTVKKQQSAVSSAAVAIQSGASFSPVTTGGNGTGAYQFSVSNPPQTNFPGHDGINVGQAGTMLPSPGNQVVAAWTPPAATTSPVTYEFYVRRWSDGEYYETAPVGPYILTVNPTTPSAPIAIGATDIAATSFTANWGAATGASGYKLDVSTVSDFTSFVGVYNNKDVPNVTYAAVSGLPTGTRYYFRVRAVNLAGTSGNSPTMQVDLGTPPTFTSAAGTVFTQGSFATFSVTAVGAPTPTVTLQSGTLPPGVTFSAVTGGATIAGTPSQDGIFVLTLRAQNTIGGAVQSATQTFALTVNSVSSPTAFVVSTVAGQAGLTGSADSPSRFNEPSGLASDGTYVYVADQTNNSIRKVSISSGTVTTFVSGLSYPAGVAVDGGGNVFVVEYGGHRIKRFSPAGGAPTLVIGSGSAGYADSDLVNSMFSYPMGIAVNSAGTQVYVADYYNSKVRRITISGTTGSVNTIASGFFPWSLALNSAATTLYVTDTGNSQVKSINLSTFAVSTLPGAYSIPRGVSVDSLGNVYVADTGTHTIKKITGGNVLTVAGYGGAYGTADGSGATARFTYPFGIVANSPTSIYVADCYNHTIRRLLPDGPPPPTAPLFTNPATATFANGSFGAFTLTASGYPSPAFSITAGSLPPGLSLTGTSIAGTPNVSGTLPSAFNFTVTATNAANSVTQNFTLTVTAATAPTAFQVSTVAGQVGATGLSDTLPGLFNEPSGMATDGTYVYIADQSNHKIRRIHIATGALTSLGSGLLYPGSVAVDGAGNLYVTDTSHQQVKSFTPTGTLRFTVGSGATGATNSDFATSSFSTPIGIAVNTAGTIAYVADYFNACIRRINISGGSGTVTSIPLGFQVWNVALDATGSTLYLSDYSNGLIKALAVPSGGTLTTLAGSFGMPRGLTVDALGNVYVVETGARRIKRITGNTVVTVAGDGAVGSINGAGLSARFYDPFGAIATSTTSVFVADMRNHTIRRMLPDSNAPAFTTASLPTFTAGVAGSFTFMASGTPAPTFSLTAGALPPGMTFSGATISGAPTSTGTFNFSITATNTLGFVTQNFTLTVSTPSAPQIVIHPVGRTRDVGRAVQFRVEVTGNPAPTLSWSKNGVPLSDSRNYLSLTSNRFTISALNASDAGNYTVTATNGVGTPATSSAATLVVNPLPLVPDITLQPQSQTFPNTGVPVTFPVTARGVGTLSYQWFKNGLPLPGATTRTYSIPSLLQTDYGSYHVEVRNLLGVVNSALAVLDNGAPPVAASIVLPSVFRMARKGTPFFHNLASPNPEVAPITALRNWVGSGLLPAGLALSFPTGTISGTPTTTSVVPPAPVFYSALSASGAVAGYITICVLDADSLPWIHTQPLDQIVNVGGTLRVQAYADTVAVPLQYRWYRNGTLLGGQTSAQLVIANVQSTDAANYSFDVSSPRGTTLSSSFLVSVVTAGATGSAPEVLLNSVSVTKPGSTTPFNIAKQQNLTDITFALPGAGGRTADVGDTITITTTARDVDSDLSFHSLKILAPDIERSDLTGNWNNTAATNWVDPAQSGGPANPFLYLYPKDGVNRYNPPSRTVSFLLDAPGYWQFHAEAGDGQNNRTGLTTDNSLRLFVRSPTLTSEPTIPNPNGRLVGAYFNAGQGHRGYYLQNMWRPASGRWDYPWGPNYVAPLAHEFTDTAETLGNPIPGMDYLGWSALNSTLTPPRRFWSETDIAKRMAAELHYAGVDFVVFDHTNLVFSNERERQILSFSNTDNEVTRAATSLMNGFETYASTGGPAAPKPRIKIAFMLGLTTAWYMDGMPRSNPSLELVPKSWPQPPPEAAIEYNKAQVDEYIRKSTADFNALLQTIWDNYASRGSDVWQDDNNPVPANRKPLLFLYVGTDGPAMHRDPETGTLMSVAFDLTNDAFCLKVRTGGQSAPYRPINEVFTIKYVASGMGTGDVFDKMLPAKVAAEKTINGVTRTFYHTHWSFRELKREFPLMGTHNGALTNPVEAVHIAAYRDSGENGFISQLDAAVALKPRFLMLAAWNEFGAESDEPSPAASWTIMPNNKYGRRYTEILRPKIDAFKAASP